MYRFFVFISLLITFSSAALAYQAPACSIPYDLKPWDYWSKKAIQSGKDWQSKRDTDYWKLVYSWSDGFCQSKGSKAKKYYQCRQSFDWIVHGLWAQSVSAHNIRQHPRNCVDTAAVPVFELKKNFCLMPDVKLMQKQFEKHGSCDYKDPEQYFSQIKKLSADITLPDASQMKRLQGEKTAVIKSWMVKNNKAMRLKAEYIDISFYKKNRIKEIAICYDLNFELRDCRSKKLTPKKKSTQLSRASEELSQSYQSNDDKQAAGFFRWIIAWINTWFS